jgi:hypothetical protein
MPFVHHAPASLDGLVKVTNRSWFGGGVHVEQVVGQTVQFGHHPSGGQILLCSKSYPETPKKVSVKGYT